MPGMVLRSVFIVLVSVIIAKFIWLGFTVHEADNVMGIAQVNLAMNDAKIIRLSLEGLWSAYTLEEEKGKAYQTRDYEVFRKKVEEIWDRLGGMPFELPDGNNFTDFSYRGSEGNYHITLKAKDKKGTLVHGTLKDLWHE
jgi:hypothetical protein